MRVNGRGSGRHGTVPIREGSALLGRALCTRKGPDLRPSCLWWRVMWALSNVACWVGVQTQTYKHPHTHSHQYCTHSRALTFTPTLTLTGPAEL